MEPTANSSTAPPEHAPPESAQPPLPPESLAPLPPLDVPKGGRDDLFVARKLKTKWVTLPTNGKQYLIANCKPGEMAWVSNQCFVTMPDPDDPKLTIVEWDSTRRGFYMVAIALRQPDGKRMYEGSLEDPSQWIYGAEKVMNIDNEDYDLLFAGVNELTGGGKGARVAAVKGSKKTSPTA